jgi:hypothetical protein
MSLCSRYCLALVQCVAREGIIACQCRWPACNKHMPRMWPIPADILLPHEHDGAALLVLPAPNCCYCSCMRQQSNNHPVGHASCKCGCSCSSSRRKKNQIIILDVCLQGVVTAKRELWGSATGACPCLLLQLAQPGSPSPDTSSGR